MGSLASRFSGLPMSQSALIRATFAGLNPAHMSAQAKENILAALLSLFCACAQFRLIAMMYQVWYGRAADAAYGVVVGMPHWRSYQSRVLGPFIIDGLAKIFSTYLSAHVIVSIVALTIAGSLAWRLGKRLTENITGALLALCLFQIAFVFCLTLPWIYIWDYLSAAIFFAFVLFVAQGKSWPWFAGLFAIAIFNRENALFIAAWMILDPVVRLMLGKRKLIDPQPFALPMVAAGIVCLAGGIAVTEFLRNKLLVREIGYEIFKDTPAHFSMVQFQLTNNLHALAHALTSVDYNMQFVVVIIVLMLGGAAIYLAWVDPARWAGLGLVHLTMLAAIMSVGILLETRLYVELIPLLVSAVMVAVSRARREDRALLP